MSEMIGQMVSDPLMVYHFSGELRKPTVKVAATDRWNAIAWYNKSRGLPTGSVVLPRAEVPFDPEIHLNKVEIAGDDDGALIDYPPVIPAKRITTDRTRYGDADPYEFPLLQHYGRGSLEPEWLIDRGTGRVVPSGEFESFPKYFLNTADKPTADEVIASGGRVNPHGGLDVEARFLNDMYPWLRLEDGEDLRNRLLDEIERYERERQ